MALSINGSTHLIPIYYSIIDLEWMKGWVGLVGWPVADGLPTLVVTHHCRSSAGQGKFASQRPTFYYCATPPTGEEYHDWNSTVLRLQRQFTKQWIIIFIIKNDRRELTPQGHGGNFYKPEMNWVLRKRERSVVIVITLSVAVFTNCSQVGACSGRKQWNVRKNKKKQ